MAAATLYPELVSGVICLDTAPAASSEANKQQTISSIEQIKSIDVEGKSRKEAIDIIKGKY